MDSFLLTSLQDPDAIIAQHRRLRTSTLQLVDALPAGAHARLREALPGIRLVQVIHVVDGTAFDEALAIAEDVDAVLLDSGTPPWRSKSSAGRGGGTTGASAPASSRHWMFRCTWPVG